MTNLNESIVTPETTGQLEKLIRAQCEQSLYNFRVKISKEIDHYLEHDCGLRWVEAKKVNNLKSLEKAIEENIELIISSMLKKESLSMLSNFKKLSELIVSMERRSEN